MDGQIGEGGKKAAANREDLTDSAVTLNDLAWKMVTSQDAGPRHPDIALKLANIAIELGDGNIDLKPKMLDTKARALFLLGKRDEAIAEQEKAVAAATVAAEKAGLETTLAAYRRGELPEVSLPAGEREPFSPAEAALAAKDLQSRMAEIVALQRRIADAEKESSGPNKDQADPLKEELRKRMAELAKLTELKDPASQKGDPGGTAYILGKLRNIVIPTVQFENTTLEEAAEFLAKRSIELDAAELDPARKGVNIVVRHPVKKPAPASGEKGGEAEAVRIRSLHLRNVPLSEALKYVCEATRFRYKVDDFAVTLISPDAPEDLFNRTFKVPPDFGSALVSIQDLLKMCGVNFREGASATLIPSGMLMVVNTPSELDKIEQLIEAVQHARANGEPDRPVPAEEAPSPVKPGER
ncbi:hypothetical protein [Luteolibacter sp. Populi]|uniref:hypothetical protein n=1 Tax=Luteolibacter sp. Populi TaxID=3230487 RepID=UPI0034660FD5